MADVQITDTLNGPTGIKIDLTHPSSLIHYLKAEIFHLAVVPEFLERKDSVLTKAAPNPMEFELKAQHSFQLGNAIPEIDVTPAAKAKIRVNATPGSDLFDDDPYHVPAMVPDHTGYVSVGFQGSLELGVSGSNGDLTFGIDNTTAIGIEYFKAFPIGAHEPTLGEALGDTLSSFVIPADLSDLEMLAVDDVAAVSGKGKLQVSGGVSVTVVPNPLASVELPLHSGSISVQEGAAASIDATFTISGSYQVRARRISLDTIELSFLKQRGTSFEADVSASAGVSVNVRSKNLAETILSAISKNPTADTKLFDGLQPDELATLTDAIQGGINHNLRASMDAVLSGLKDDQAAFQYEIQPARMGPAAKAAVHKALDGDLRLLTAMEGQMQDGGILTDGVKMLNSLVSKTRSRGVSLKINLLGILNYTTMSELIRHSEVLTDQVTGDVTIHETVTGNNIAAIVDPLSRHEALRKALFDSLLVTTSYRAGKAIASMGLNCGQVHYAINQNTNHQIMSDYLRWYVALDLFTEDDRTAELTKFIDGGPSTCLLRTSFGDADCATMFYDGSGNLRTEYNYLELGRKAMRALLDREQGIDTFRYRIVDDALWPDALRIGANVNLGTLVGLKTDDPRVGYLVGDVMVITSWAKAMANLAVLVQDMRTLVAEADPETMANNNEFKRKRDALQKGLAAMVKASKIRFDEPWGMVSLFWAGGSPHTAYAKTTTRGLTLERGSHAAIALAAG